jgi:Xaa-Pro aminopeptidase
MVVAYLTRGEPLTRVRRTQALLTERGVAAFLAGPSADLRWLTGYNALPLERLTVLAIPADGDPVLLVPVLEEPRAASSGAADIAEIVTWEEDEDPMAVLLERVGVPEQGLLAVQDRLWSVFLLRLQEALPGVRWTEGGEIMRELRVRKTSEEIAALAEAGAAIDRVHERVPEFLRPGRTERAVGREIADAILDEHDEVNFVIVASGPNGASPHHETGDRTIVDGDAVVVDIGGTRAGYCSDMTRNYVLGTTPPEYAEIHAVVEAAQQAGVDAARPGVPAEEVDAACRRVIVDAGYGDMFVHRTGHGIGVEEHEHPYIVAGNAERLQPGMAFSVEPGIYVPDRFGARIEDIVVLDDEGSRRLNRLSHTVTEVA